MAQELNNPGLGTDRVRGSDFFENKVEEIGSTNNRLWAESKLVDDKEEDISQDNPLPIYDIDTSGRTSLNSVFGDKITGTRIPTIAAQFQYGLRSDDATIDIVTTGTVAIEDAMLKLRTGTGSDGHIGIQGRDFLRYIPGHEAYAFFTCVFATPTVDSIQRIGLFDYDSGNGNGFYIGFEGLIFGITRRRAGVDFFSPVDIANVFPKDIALFDPTKGNVFRISYGYLGFAPITFAIMSPDNHIIDFARIEYPNTSNETHIANANIPLRAEMTNTGNTTNLEMRIGSVSAGIVDGGGSDPIARNFSFKSGIQTILLTQLFAFRNKSTYFGLTNKISTQLSLLSASTEGNKPVSFAIYKNATTTTPGTWTDISADSVMEYSVDQIDTIGTGELMISWNMAKSASFFEKVEDQILKLRPNEYASIYAISASTNDVELSMRWKELF